MADTLADTMNSWYASQLGHSGDTIELEREYFGAGTTDTWADVALRFYASANGSNPAGSLTDETFKYYSNLSGLTPAANYSLVDHMYVVFGSGVSGGGSGHAVTPPITDQLEAFFDAGAIDGYRTDNRVSKNKLTYNQATVETDLTGLVSSNAVRSTAQAAEGSASALVTSTAAQFVQWGVITPALGVPVVPGRTYTFVGSCYAPVITVGFVITLVYYDAAQAFVSQPSGSSITLGPTWKQNSYTVTIPAGVAYVVPRIAWTSVGAGEQVYVDKLGAWEGSSTDWVLPGKLFNINLLNYDTSCHDRGTIRVNNNYITNATVAISTAQFISAPYSLALTAVASADMRIDTGYAPPGTDLVAVTPGKTYTGVFSSRAAVNPRSMRCDLFWFKSDGTAASTASVNGTAANDSTSAWTQLTVNGVAPSDAVYALIKCRCFSPTAGEVHYYDNLGIWEGYQTTWEPPYRGASGITDGELITQWDDLSGKNRHLTQPTLTARPTYRKYDTAVSKNKLLSSVASAEEGLTGVAASTNTTAARSIAQALHGQSSVALTATGAGSLVCYFNSGIGTYGISVVAGQTYTAVAALKAGTTGRTFTVGIDYYTAADAYISSLGSASFVDNTSEWIQAKVTNTAPPTAAKANVYVNVLSVGAAEVHYVDCVGFWDGTLGNDWVMPGQPVYNLLTHNQATIEVDATGFVTATATPTFSRSTAITAAQGNAELLVTSIGAGTMSICTLAGTSGVPVVPGRTYTFYAEAQLGTVPAGTNCIKFYYRFWDSAGTALGAAVVIGATTTGAVWTRVGGSVVAPANAAYANVYLGSDTPSGAGQTMYWDKIGIWEGTKVEWQAPVVLSNLRPTVQFDGLDDIIKSSFYFTAPPITVYTVYLARNRGGGASRAIWGNSLAGDVGLRQMAGNDGGDDGVTYSGLFGYTFGVGVVDASKVTSTQIPSGASQPDLRINGTAQALDASGTNTPTAGNGHGLGGSFTHGNYLMGQVACHLVYSALHTTAQRQQIERWLGARYGVTVA